MVDDEGCCVLEDLAVLVGQCQVGACDWCGGLLRALLLTLQSKKNKTSVKYLFCIVNLYACQVLKMITERKKMTSS